MTSILQILKRRSVETPDAKVFTFLEKGEQPGHPMTFRELEEQSLKIAEGISRLASKGDRVLLLFPQGMDFIRTFFACMQCGVIAIPCSIPTKREKLKRTASIINNANPTLAICAPQFLTDRKTLKFRTTHKECQWITLDDIHQEDRLPEDFHQEDESTIAYLQYTSGSTGNPKGTIVTHGNVIHNINGIQAEFQHSEKSIILSWVPFFHDLGLIYGVLQPVQNGCHCYLMAPIDFVQNPLRWLKAITKYKVTHTSGPNFAYELCLSIPENLREGLDLSSMEVALNGAEVVRPSTIESFNEIYAPYGWKTTNWNAVYGMAESTLAIISTAFDVTPRFLEYEAQDNPGDQLNGQVTNKTLVSNGFINPFTDVKIVNTSTFELCEEGQIGEIWMAGESMTKGYWNNEKATKETFNAQYKNGEAIYLRSGDFGFMDKGELFFVGRIKEVIIVKGENFYPTDLEQLAEVCHDSIKQSGSCAFSYEQDGEEKVGLICELKRVAIRKFPLDEVVKIIRSKMIEEFGLRLSAIYFIRPMTLSRTTSGKIKRVEVKKLFLHNEISSLYQWEEPRTVEVKKVTAKTSQAPGKTQVMDWLITTLAELCAVQINAINPEEPFSYYGMDSKIAVLLAQRISGYFNHDFSATLLYDYPNISVLTEKLCTTDFQKKDQNSTENKAPDTKENIAIIGMACRFPGADNLKEYWELLASGKSVTSPQLEKRWAQLDSKIIAEHPAISYAGTLKNIDQFDPQFFGITPREAILMDPQQRLLLEVCWEALQDAGIKPNALKSSNTGVYLGICGNEYAKISVNEQASAHALTGTAKSIAASRISYLLDLKGPALAIDTACSSSLVAIHRAVQDLRTGEIDRAIVGGVNLLLDPAVSLVCDKAGMLSSVGKCQTFDAKANGYVRSEGCGIIILERQTAAVSNHQNIWASIRSSAINQDGKSNGITAPNGLSQVQVIDKAIKSARIKSNQIAFFEAHGTGTPLGDPIEVNALKQIVNGETGTCWLGSAKANIGHLEAAAGIAGLIKVALCLNKGIMPPQANFSVLNPEINLEQSKLEIPQTTKHLELENNPFAGVSSFGFGGTNAHVILEHWSSPIPAPEDGPEEDQLILLSAQSTTALQELVARYRNQLADFKTTGLAALSYSTIHNQAISKVTLGLCAKNFQELETLLMEHPELSAANTFQVQSKGGRIPKMAWVFTGQGSQYADMGKSLYDSNPYFKSQLDNCYRILAKEGLDLFELLFGAKKEELQNTEYAQPAIFSIEYALAKLLLHWGLSPNTLIGHSIGEYVAACISGILSLEDALRMIALRGRLMQAMPSGGMTVVFADEEKLKNILSTVQNQVAIAAYNTNESIVLSGETEALESIHQFCKAREITCKALRVSHAFHSPMTRTILEEFRNEIQDVDFSAPNLPIISSLTGQEVGKEMSEQEYWIRHIEKPVDFRKALQLASKQHQLFLEIGPRAQLQSILHQNLPDAWVFSSLRGSGEDQKDLLLLLGKLHALKYTLNWEKVFTAQIPVKVKLPFQPYERQRYWVEEQQIQTMPIQHAQSETNHQLGTNNMVKQSNLKDQVLQLISKVLQIKAEKIDLNTAFTEIGADSIMLMELLRKIKSEFKIELSISKLFGALSTVRLLTEYIQENTQSIPEPMPSPKAQEEQAVPNTPVAKAATNSISPSGDLSDLLQKQLQVLDNTLSKQLELLGNVPMRAKTESPAPNNTPSPSLPTSRPGQISPTHSVRSNKLSELHQLTDKQQLYFNELLERYTRKTAGSKQHFATARDRHADLLNCIGFRLMTKEFQYPIVSKECFDARIIDIDDNEYIDLAMGYGVNFFGNNPPFLTKALADQIGQGHEMATQSLLAAEVAKSICDLVGAERMAFLNSGTEAVMTAMRAARAVTGKNKIVLFNGCYHGTFDGYLGQEGDENTPVIPMTPGTTQSMVDDLIILNYGQEKALEEIQKQAGEIAAVLIEPVQSRKPEGYDKAFLQALRKVTAQNGVALIYDEIISGFRMHPGGMQAISEVKADIITYGKVIGGGMPIGIIAGSRRYIDALDGGAWSHGDQSYPTVDRTFFGGTFCKHPLTLAAANATVKRLCEEGPALQESVNKRTAYLEEELNRFFNSIHVPMIVVRNGSMFRFKTTGKYNMLLAPIELDLFFYSLIEKGIYTWERRICFLSVAHTQKEIEQIILKVKETIFEMLENGFFPESGYQAGQVESESTRQVELTPVQKELYLLSTLDQGGSIACNMTLALKCQGDLQPALAQRAIHLLAEHHEALRIRFSKNGDYQEIQSSIDTPFAFTEIPVQNGAVRSYIENYLEKESKKAFDIHSGPLFRVALLKESPRSSYLVFTVHHLVADGWSVGVLFKDFGEIYAGLLKEENPKLEPALSFRTYLQRLNTLAHKNKIDRQKEYWLKQLEGRRVSKIPFSKLEGRNSNYAGQRIQRKLSKTLYGPFIEQSKKEGCTPFMSLYAAFVLLMHKLGGDREFFIGVPTSGRDFETDKLMVGSCADMMVMAHDLDPNTSFTNFMKKVKVTLLDAYENQDATYSYIKEELELKGSNKINISFNLDSNFTLPQIPEMEMELIFPPISFIHFDFVFDLSFIGDQIHIDCDYRTDAFDRKSIEQFLSQFETLIQNLTGALDTPIANLEILNSTEKTLLSVGFNPGPAVDQPTTPVPLLLEKIARENPEQIAFVSNGQAINFGQLNARANHLAHFLKDKYALKPGEVIAVEQDGTIEMILAILAIFKLGGIYLPCSSNERLERLEEKCLHAKASYLLSNKQAINASKKIHIVPIEWIKELPKFGTVSTINLDISIPADAAAYWAGNGSGMILKSHKVLTDSVLGDVLDVNVVPGNTGVQILASNSEVYLTGLFSLLLGGATVHLLPTEMLTQKDKVLQYLEQNHITILSTTPSWLSNINFAELLGIRKIITTGEAANVKDVRYYTGFLSKEYYTRYSNQSLGICGALYKVEQEDIDLGIIPIGKPSVNEQWQILNASGALCPIGIPGEMVVGELLRTGEEMKWTETGALIFCGSKNRQIEKANEVLNLYAIEQKIQEHPAILAIRLELLNQEGGTVVTAFIKKDKKAKEELTPYALKYYFRKELPEYMMPEQIVLLEAIPMTEEYLCDVEKMLEGNHSGVVESAAIEMAGDEIEMALLEIWKEVLGAEEINLNSDFFEMGGHSLNAMQIGFRVEEQFSVRIELKDIIDNPTVKMMASWIEASVSLSKLILPEPKNPIVNEAHRVFWKDYFTAEIPKLNLAVDCAFRPDKTTFVRANESLHFNKELNIQLENLRKQKGIDLLPVLLSGLAHLLYRYTQNTKMILGTLLPIADRQWNQLPLIIDFKEEIGFNNLLQKTQKELIRVLAHREYPFADLMEDLSFEQDRNYAPLFDVLLSLVEEDQVTKVLPTNNCDLFFQFYQDANGDLNLNLEYDANLFEKERIQAMLYHFESLLLLGLNEGQEALWTHDYLSEKEKTRLLEDFRGTKKDRNKAITLVDMFEQTVQENKDQIALVDGSLRVSFTALNEVANQLAHYLIEEEKVQIGDRILIVAEPGFQMIVGLLAILKAGATYIPVDPAYPKERVRQIYEISQPKLILTDDTAYENSKAYEKCLIPAAANFDQYKAYKKTSPQVKFDAENLAYIFFTSGSTGTPKGVSVKQESVINTIAWVWEDLGFNQEDVILQKTSFTFDVSVWEIFVPLCFGAKLVCCPKEMQYRMDRLHQYINEEGVTSMSFVPSALVIYQEFLLRKKTNINSPLKRIFSAGEALRAQLVKTHYELFSFPLYNIYGPTEAAIYASFYLTQKEDVLIPIGKPIANTELLVLDKHGRLCPPGVSGEIAIGGKGLATGYFKNKTLTDQVFIDHPYRIGEKIYLSGDLGKIRPDGDMIYLGRKDHQIKLRGFRIELKEIEAILCQQEQVKDAVVLLKEGVSPHLLGYVIAEAGLDSETLKSFLQSKLPSYMVPPRFIFLQQFPATASRKVDRKALAKINSTPVLPSKEYWTNKFSGEIPRLNLPVDFPVRPPEKEKLGALISHTLNAETVTSLYQLNKQKGYSPLVILSATVAALLNRYTHNRRILLGTSAPNAKDSLVLDITVDDQNSFDKLLLHAKQTIAEAYTHQDFSVDLLLQELNLQTDASFAPLYDVFVACFMAEMPEVYTQCDFDLSFLFQEKNQEITLHLLYDTQLFHKARIERLLVHFENLLTLLLADRKQAVFNRDYLPETEKTILLETFRGPDVKLESGITIPDLFEKTAQQNSRRIALVDGAERMSYGKLDRRSNQLAHYLIDKHQVKVGDRVMILAKPGYSMVLGLLSILKAGASYVPVDASFPEARIRKIYDSCTPKVVLTDDGNYPGMKDMNHALLPGIKNDALTKKYPVDRPQVDLKEEDTAYIIYTSGSTGEPKGVMINHKSLYNRIDWMWNAIPFDKKDIILQKTSFTFDVSVWEFFMTLCYGARLVCCPKGVVYNMELLAEFIEEYKVTTMHFVPGALALFQNHLLQEFDGKSSLKRIICSGEALKPEHVKNHYQIYSIPLYNLYGPTEATVDVSLFHTHESNEIVPIGKPIWNTELLVLDNYNQLCALGFHGQIAIGGVGLAKGYYNNETLTNKAFIDHPFRSGEKLYLTGDIGKLEADGDLIYLGRKDHQVKLRGLRIELGEIEAVLCQHEKVENAVVIVKQGSSPFLVAYVRTIGETNSRELKQYLSSKLPVYMVPAAFVLKDEFPFNSSGKIDRKRLLSAGASQKKSNPALATPTPKITSTYFPASLAQQRLWTLTQIEGVQAAYNIFGAFELKGNLDTNALEKAVDFLLERHAILRTSFELKDGVLQQKITSYYPGYSKVKLENLEKEANAMQKVEAILEEEARFEFDLEKGPLVKFALLKLATDLQVLVFNIHHILADGWSIAILFADLEEAYRKYRSGALPALPELKMQYSDFATWHKEALQSERFEEHRNFWKEKFADGIPRLNLPTDVEVRPSRKNYAGATQTIKLNNEVASGIYSLSKEKKLTPFMILLAGVSALLNRYTSSKTILLGTTVLGRNKKELENQIGFYVNLLALGIEVDKEQPFMALLENVRETLLEALAHQEYPFDLLISDLGTERDLSHAPLFDVYVSINNRDLDVNFDQLEASFRPAKFQTSKYDLSFNFQEDGENIELEIEYDTNLFGSEKIQKMLLHYENLYQSILLDQSKALWEYEYLPAEEKQLLLNDFRGKNWPIPAGLTIPKLFERITKSHPSKVALKDGKEAFTYEQLDGMANQLAHYLVTAKEVTIGDRIIIVADRGYRMIVGIMAILKAGAIYVPVNPDFPADRVKQIYEACEPKVIVADSTSYPAISHFDHTVIPGLEDQSLVKGYSTKKLNLPTTEDDIAYIIYTSGSTGVPKGVTISHKSLYTRMNWMWEELGFDQTDVILQKTSFTFDVSIWEIFPSLCYGACLVCCPKDRLYDMNLLHQEIMDNEVTTLNFVPTALVVYQEFLLQLNDPRPSPLRRIISGGETLKPQMVKNHFELFDIPLYNNYGPTEVSVTICSAKIEDPNQKITIGKALHNVDLLVLDAHRQLCPIGVQGEIAIGGIGISDGYYKNPELTDKVFVEHPYRPGERIYLTGDYGKMLPDGNLAFLGRKDAQIKLRGFRIELGEIEAVLSQHEEVNEAVVLLKRGAIPLLVAYVVGNDTLTPTELRNHVNSKLPAYMVPSDFMLIEEFPLNNSGKIDRKALLRMDAFSSDKEQRGPENDIQRGLFKIWEELLGHANFGIDQNFFSVGGDSIKVISLAGKILEVFDQKILSREIFRHQTIAALADHLQKEGTGLLSETTGQREQWLKQVKHKIITDPRLAEWSKEDWEEVYPMSDIQTGMFFYSELETQDPLYHQQMYFQFEEESLNLDLLEKSLRIMMDRHPILRTSFHLSDADIPFQVVHQAHASEPQLIVQDISNLAYEEKEKWLSTYLEMERADNRFISSKPGLFRTTLVKLSAIEFGVLFSFHHAVLDGWSYASMVTELVTVYADLKKGISYTGKALQSNYKNYVYEQDRIAKDPNARAFWTEALKGFSRTALPFNKMISGDDLFGNEAYSFSITSKQHQAVQDLAVQQGVSPKDIYLAAFMYLMKFITGEDEITIGLVSTNRLEETDGEKVLGCFLNSVPFRYLFDQRIIPDAFIQSIADHQNRLKEFDQLSLIQIMQLIGQGRREQNSVFDTLFSYQDFHVYQELPEAIRTKRPLVQSFAKHNTFFDFTVSKREKHANVELVYNTGLYQKSEIKRIALYYRNILNLFTTKLETVINNQSIFATAELTGLQKGWESSQLPAHLFSTFEEWMGAEKLAAAKIYLLDQQLQMVPTGVSGEIYYSLPENEHTETEGERRFKTGFLAKASIDQPMQYEGSLDQQIVFKGNRFDAGMIDYFLHQYEDVTEAITLVKDEPQADAMLVCYVAAKDTTTVENLQYYLKDKLSIYHQPDRIIVLAQLPKMEDGAMDLDALLALTKMPPTASEIVSDEEATMLKIWEKTLHQRRVEISELENLGPEALEVPITIDDNFFSLGGDSILAMHLSMQIQKEMNKTVGVKDIFNHPTVRGLNALTNESKPQFLPIPRLETQPYYNASPTQTGFYLSQKLSKDKVRFNLFGAFMLHGPLDLEVFQEAYCLLLERHESLRTSFDEVEGEVKQFVQFSNKADIPPIQCKDYSMLVEPEKAVLQDLKENGIYVFDLANAPLLHLQMNKLAEDQHLMAVNIHHIICDDWSFDVLLRELKFLYEAVRSKSTTDTLPPLKIQYKDYVAWYEEELNQQGAALKDFWLKYLPVGVPRLKLPLDHPRPNTRSNQGVVLKHQFPEQELRAISQMLEPKAITLNMFFSAMVTVFLHKITRQEDIILGTPLSGRVHPDLENQIGLFINTLVLYNRVEAQQPFRHLLHTVKRNILAIQENQLYPFDQLVQDLNIKRELGQNPLFDVWMVYHNVAVSEQEYEELATDISMTPIGEEIVLNSYDLKFTFIKRKDSLELHFQYSKDLFTPEHGAILFESFLACIDHFKKDLEQAPASFKGYTPAKTKPKLSSIKRVRRR